MCSVITEDEGSANVAWSLPIARWPPWRLVALCTRLTFPDFPKGHTLSIHTSVDSLTLPIPELRGEDQGLSSSQRRAPHGPSGSWRAVLQGTVDAGSCGCWKAILSCLCSPISSYIGPVGPLKFL